jgi:hypothetical protein
MSTTIYNVKERKWNLLWRCKRASEWRTLWEAPQEQIEIGLLKLEHKMCHFMWTHGFNETDIVNVVAAWWDKHDVKGSFYRLRHMVIPNTYRFAEKFLLQMETNQLERQRISQAKWRAKKRARAISNGLMLESTRQLVLRYAASHDALTAGDLEATTGRARSTLSRQLSRLATEGSLVRVAYGKYALAVAVSNE